MLCMTRICSPTCFRIASCTRLAILNTVTFHWDKFVLLTSTSKRVLPKKSTIFPRFLPAMASNHASMNYYRAYSKNHCVHNLLALWLSARMCWQWAGPKLHSLLSAHYLIGTYFLTTESDKRMHLLTRLYSSVNCKTFVPTVMVLNMTIVSWVTPSCLFWLHKWRAPSRSLLSYMVRKCSCKIYMSKSACIERHKCRAT